ncbi:hypothetical protein LEP1GSC049_0061 [Leptospira kirschneri serovar Cynopteri str. 3522 CT]|nr:hypothetical protein LEP1GSC042_1938 [Leptospira kirschneri serovar Bim str. PUO 1247]EMN02998.1 hypothetical protein LEP1GSC046_0963 [Leptospira kirschneri serovar Bim str. 1051]EPG49366.1 hypothetical protein LEP1GSC049_0061 [Leptospira kirschneri serovar Cynopteri str. 3522 CT]
MISYFIRGLVLKIKVYTALRKFKINYNFIIFFKYKFKRIKNDSLNLY